MELDKRIIEGKTYLDCFDTEVAKGFIGKECYVTDGVASFANVDNLNKAVLIEVDDENIKPYTLENTRWRYSSNFILPCEWVKKPEEPEKKYRAYTLKEFIGDVNLGLEPWIRMRPVGTNKECKFLYTGYQETEVGEYICLGCYQFDFISLFKNYEIYINGEWQPFGVIDEDKE